MNCPDCDAFLRAGAKRCRCGWAETSTRLADPRRYLCADEFQGQRCAKLGTISTAVSGDIANGKWYCAEHAPQFRSMRKDRTVTPDFTTIKQAVRRAAPVNLDALDEAAAERAALQADA